MNGSRGLLSLANAAGGNVSPSVGPAQSPFAIATGNNLKGTIAHIREGAGTVSGIVYSTGTTPQAGAIVRIYDDVSGALIGTATSASDGTFSIPAHGYTSVLAVCEQSGLNAQVFDLITPV